jgi:bifunctional non-homologous end joining protein LigD
VALEKYHAKRTFSATPEPKGKSGRTSGKKLAFVIQEHHASRLHYDFRLEMDGVLKSWAIPKGPSMDPHERHLAVHTEDHPFEYRKFEGTIPEGNYGAGNVIIWDEGWYEARADTDNHEKTLLKEHKDGHITFVLHGKKLHGEFALIKMHGKDEDAWLFIKKGDEFASDKDITRQDRSVRTGRKVDDLGGKLPDLSDYPNAAKPWAVKPMLCTLVDEPFSRVGWLFEIKWDGYRAVASKKGSDVALYSRNHIDFSEKFAAVYEAMHQLEHDVIFDGEIVVVDGHGAPHFEWLQGWKQNQYGSLRYYVFDVLWVGGLDVRDMPLVERKALLRQLIPHDSDIVRYSDHVEHNGLALYKEMQKRGLEGVVAKKADSTYHENDRGSAWLKIKTHLRQEVVIGGFTEPRGTRKHLGSLIVGVYQKGELVYVGHSGGGIPDDQRKALRATLDKLERKTSPFVIQPKPNAPVHWVKPELVCEMNFSEWTSDGYMRHPSFVGMREDKKPVNVRRERAKRSIADVPKGGSMHSQDKLEFSHLDKVFFPKHKYTKGDLIEYYRSVADYILPYLHDRACSLNRMPNGITGDSFYQKNMEHLPDWVASTDIYSDSNAKNLHWLVADNLDAVLYMVQLGCIEINPWNSRTKHLDKPDWLVIDLDPEGISFEKVIAVAQTVHEVCDEWGVPAYPKTSGKTGIHIFVPLGAKYTHEQAKNFAHLLALEINKRQPKITSVERMPEKRKHRIYLDFLQNREGQTLAAPYSVRPTPDASVSTPLHWDEVVSGLKPSDFTIRNIGARLAREGDLWKPVMGKGIDLTKILKKLEQQ